MILRPRVSDISYFGTFSYFLVFFLHIFLRKWVQNTLASKIFLKINFLKSVTTVHHDQCMQGIVLSPIHMQSSWWALVHALWAPCCRHLSALLLEIENGSARLMKLCVTQAAPVDAHLLEGGRLGRRGTGATLGM